MTQQMYCFGGDMGKMELLGNCVYPTFPPLPSTYTLASLVCLLYIPEKPVSADIRLWNEHSLDYPCRKQPYSSLTVVINRTDDLCTM